MTTVRKIFLCLVLMLMAYSASSADQTVEPSKEAQELVALLNKYGIAKNPSDALNLTQGLSDLFVDQVLVQLGQGNSDWNKGIPAWKKLESTIRADIANYQQSQLAQAETYRKQLGQSLVLAYDHELGSDGIEYLLNFYRSSLGQSYLNFSMSADKIIFSCVTVFERMQKNGEHLSLPAKKEDQDAWGKRLDLLIKALSLRVVDSSRNIGAIQYLGNVVMGCTLIKGQEFDEIGKKYELDLPEIDSYIANEYSKKELTLINATLSKAVAPIVMDYQNWLKNKQESWKKMYFDLTQKTVEP